MYIIINRYILGNVIVVTAGRRLSIVNSSTGLHPIGEGDDEDDNADGDEDENPGKSKVTQF